MKQLDRVMRKNSAIAPLCKAPSRQLTKILGSTAITLILAASGCASSPPNLEMREIVRQNGSVILLGEQSTKSDDASTAAANADSSREKMDNKAIIAEEPAKNAGSDDTPRQTSSLGTAAREPTAAAENLVPAKEPAITASTGLPAPAFSPPSTRPEPAVSTIQGAASQTSAGNSITPIATEALLAQGAALPRPTPLALPTPDSRPAPQVSPASPRAEETPIPQGRRNRQSTTTRNQQPTPSPAATVVSSPTLPPTATLIPASSPEARHNAPPAVTSPAGSSPSAPPSLPGENPQSPPVFPNLANSGGSPGLPTTPPPPPVTEWHISAGQTLQGALRMWADQAGYRLSWEVPFDYPIRFDATFRANTLLEAVEQVVETTRAARIPLRYIARTGNRVLRIVEW